MADIRIIGTGSSGNCAEVNGDILVDLGLRKGDIPDEVVRRVSACLVTHEHSDHIMPPTFKWLADMRPDIVSRQFFANEQTLNHLLSSGDSKLRAIIDRIPSRNVISHASEFDIRSRSGVYHVRCFKCPHGFEDRLTKKIPLENQGFVIESPDGERIVWATDTMSMEFAPNEVYDCICVEGNYDQRLLDAAKRDPVLFNRAIENERHLSVQEFERFVLTHSHEGTKVVQLHMSGEFGMVSAMNTEDMSQFYG